MVEGKKRMTAKRKLEVYLETRQKDANVGEILRRSGLHLNDLRRIETFVERAALDALKGRPSGEQGAALNGKEYAELVAELAQKEKAVTRAAWVDLSCRELSIKILETKELYVSHVAIWEYERAHGLAGHRGKRRLMRRHRGEAPDTSFVHGPNQLWTWDFTKVPTGIPHQCWYLVAVEDQYSREAVGWTMGARATTELAKAAWDAALLAEGLPAAQMPFSLSDRGPQMRSRAMREFFQDLGVARTRQDQGQDLCYPAGVSHRSQGSPRQPSIS